jgi:hypothetical protein
MCGSGGVEHLGWVAPRDQEELAAKEGQGADLQRIAQVLHVWCVM